MSVLIEERRLAQIHGRTWRDRIHAKQTNVLVRSATGIMCQQQDVATMTSFV